LTAPVASGPNIRMRRRRPKMPRSHQRSNASRLIRRLTLSETRSTVTQESTNPETVQEPPGSVPHTHRHFLRNSSAFPSSSKPVRKRPETPPGISPLGSPADALRQQLTIVRVCECFRPMAKLNEDYPRLPLSPRPGQRLAALGVPGGQQRRYVRLHSKPPVDFVVNCKILQPCGHWMILGHNEDWDLHIVLVAHFRCHHAALAIGLRVPAAEDL